MFNRTDQGVYQSSLLSSLPWVQHGFATRHAQHWPGEYTSARQVHSNVVLCADSSGDILGQGDAVVTSVPDRWIGVRTADCVPILIADPANKVVAAVHAGWRGTLADISCRAVEEFATRYASTPADLLTAIGPCIGFCCFEVGPEVSVEFERLFPEKVNSRRVDLVEANRRQLIRAGVQPDNIDVSGLCTVCNATEFHSYRRDREQSGRMVAAIAVRS